MSKIAGFIESVEDRTRANMPLENPRAFIAQEETDGVFSIQMPAEKKSSAGYVPSGKQLFKTKYADTLTNTSRRESVLADLVEATGNGITVSGSSKYVSSPYNYSRIDDFFRKESYFSRSIYRQIETMMRNGYEINSDDTKALQVVKREISRISRESKIGFDQFLFQVARNILKYGICVPRKLKNTRTKKITRLTTIHPSNIVFRFDNTTGELLGITDRNPSLFGKAINAVFKNIKRAGRSVPSVMRPNEIPMSDVGICLLYDPGEIMFPEPPSFQLLDDILTLRSLEETIELLAFQFGSPLLHVQVGSKEAPVTREQMLAIHNEFVSMASNGMVTTDYNTNVKVINLQTGIADLMPYVEHFKKRVLSGASSSQVSIGESDTGTRSSTESIDNALADHCSYVSSIIANMVNSTIIPDILISNGYTEQQIYDASGDFLVKMEFLDVDTSKMISSENHALSLYQGNAITRKEMRRMMMKPPLTDADVNDTYLNNVQIPLRQAGAEETASDSSAASTKSKDQPSNQHGSKLSPGSTKK